MSAGMRRMLPYVLLAAALTLPAAADCERCVIGGDGLAWCRPEFYLPHWPLVSDCEPIIRCHLLANGAFCYTDCDGAWCYQV